KPVLANRLRCWAYKWVWPRCPRVFVDQSIEDRAASDVGGGPVGDLRPCWRRLVQRTMWSMFVVVRGVLAEDLRQMTFANNEHSVGALTSDGAHPAFGERGCP